MMKSLPLLLLISLMFGCAQTMTVPAEKIDGSSATMILDATALEGYINIPLINYKVANVFLSEFPDCVDGKATVDKSKKLGKATLTTKENTQEVIIPSGKKVLISANSYEKVGGNTYTCWNSVHFTPEENETYLIKLNPHKSFGSEKCKTQVFKVSAGENVPADRKSVV